MIRRTARRAHRSHRCERELCLIKRGEVYLELVFSPGHDGVCPDGWSKAAECERHARLYGRGHLIDARKAAA